MDTKEFKELCESVVLVEEFPPLSRLRQKVAGCYDIFGMCPEGEVVGLDTMGNVNCLKAEINDNRPWCQENASQCLLNAINSNIIGIIKLLKEFRMSNFITKDGYLNDNQQNLKQTRSKASKNLVTGSILKVEYDDEDLGVSEYFSHEERARRRPR